MLQQKNVKGQSGGGNKISYKAVTLHCIPLLSFTQPPVLFTRPPFFLLLLFLPEAYLINPMDYFMEEGETQDIFHHQPTR